MSIVNPKQIEVLDQKILVLNSELARINTTITALQKLCDHTRDDGTTAYLDWGDDHNYTYYVCEICHKRKQE